MSSSIRPADVPFLKTIKPFFSLFEKYFRYEVRGFDHIPHKRSLVVMNHGIIPFHGFLLAKQYLEKRHKAARGLGADFLFHTPGLKQFFTKGGAVAANPENAKRLLLNDECVMVAPGGIYEALIAKEGLRRIPWERRMGFVEIAVETSTPIVPTYCRGINGVYLNSYFLLKPRIKLLEKTRFSLPFFCGIGLLPLPKKLIHLVGKPISTRRIRGETKAQQIKRIHQEVIHQLTLMAKTGKVP